LASLLSACDRGRQHTVSTGGPSRRLLHCVPPRGDTGGQKTEHSCIQKHVCSETQTLTLYSFEILLSMTKSTFPTESQEIYRKERVVYRERVSFVELRVAIHSRSHIQNSMGVPLTFSITEPNDVQCGRRTHPRYVLRM
jgi:hypothetical protein